MTTLAANFWQTTGMIFRLLRWDKPAGRLILMIPALWAVFLAAKGAPPPALVGVIILGTLATSGAGCVVNDLWDRDLDPLVERTKHRPLADRSLSIVTGVVVGLISLICAAGLALYLNPLTFWLCVAAVPVILFYPSAKRFFPVPQLVLSIAWGFAVLISWTAVSCNGSNFSFSAGLANFACIPSATWWLWAATILWTLGFDTVYAMSDREDDLKVGINSSAIFFGNYAAIAVGLCFAATTGLLAQLGWVLNLHLGFWLSLGGAIVLWGWQFYHLSRPLVPAPVYPAIFRQNVWIGFILLGGMIMGISGR
ncbi:MAG: 4-hydroxybenzoate octaprenyltransferase [Coleofasciculaceae cyanobacterium SM2_1_6]|nr:4-hydroxybenzoate octaprenyltransferase [Coleofasciculaceae cyanobacterium SM2_1_6]